MAERRAAVVVVSDGVAAGERQDRSGALAVEMLAALGFEVGAPSVVPDDASVIAGELVHLCDAGHALVVTTGGTGFAPRDVTPEATRQVIDREAPGLAEAVRAGSPAPFGMLSRAVAGLRGATLVMNLPGSTGGVRDGINLTAPALHHAVALAAGESPSHPHA